MDPEKRQAFEQAFGFAFLDDRDDLLPLAERIIILKLGILASKVIKQQIQLQEILEKAKTELSADKCVVLYNEATDTTAQIKRAELEFQEAVGIANSTKRFTFNTDYAAYPSPIEKNTTEELTWTTVDHAPAIGMR